MSTNALLQLRQLLVDELERLDERLTTNSWLCCCGPCYYIDGRYWAYSRVEGWHDPSIDHDALWPIGGAA